MVELHSKLTASLRSRTEVGCVAEHFRKGNFRVYNLCARSVVGGNNRTAASGYVAHNIAEIIVGNNNFNLHNGL